MRLPGKLHTTGWAANSAQDVLVVGETPKRYRIACFDDKPIRLAGRHRHLNPGETALVPKYAVSLNPNPQGEES